MKRPMVYLLLAYIVGMLCNYLDNRIILCIYLLILFLLIYMVLKKSISKNSYLYLLTSTFLFILGYTQFYYQLKPTPIEQSFDRKTSCHIVGKVEVLEDRDDYQIIILKDNQITIDNHEHYSKRVRVYSTNTPNLKIGYHISVEGQIQKFQPASNLGQFDEAIYYKIRSIDFKVNAKHIEIMEESYSKYYNFLYTLRLKLSNIYHQIIPKKEAGILSAMILGEKSYLETDIKELYSNSGISHILAISGLHVSLFGMALYQFLLKLHLPLWLSTFVSIFILISYGILTNFSVSTNRAVVMLICLMIGKLIGRTYDILTSTMFSALIILIRSPMELFNVGFLLSFGAILGIALLVPIFNEIFPAKSKLLQGLYASVGVQCITLPIVLYYFYQIPLYGVLVNLVIIPLSSSLLLIGFIAALIGLVFLPLSEFIIGGSYYILRLYELICKLSIKLPFSSILVGRPTILAIMAFYIVILLFITINKKRTKKRSLLLFTFLLIIFIKPKTNLEITFLDVGQGDGIFFQTPSKTTYFIDGGSTSVKEVGKYRIEPFLLAKGIRTLDYVFITHMDEDHISGIVEIMCTMQDSSNMEDSSTNQGSSTIQDDNKKGLDMFKHSYNSIEIKHLVLPTISSMDETYQSMVSLAKQKGIQVLYFEQGDMIMDREVQVKCLHPNLGFDFTSKNSYSMVLSVNYHEFNLLLTGDIEGVGEALIINQLVQEQKLYEPFEYDVLKVSHHGSKNSTSSNFLHVVQPSISIISASRDNTYGHPHNELLERIDDIESEVAITYESGAITIKSDGKRMVVEKYFE